MRETRKTRAKELLERIERGPSGMLKSEWVFGEFTRESYDVWFKTWIKPELQRLIPELKEMTNGREDQHCACRHGI